MSIKLFIANWKMNKTVKESIDFCQKNSTHLQNLKNKLIIAPTTPALTLLQQILKDSDVALCGQSCSAFTTGSYTGQVAAKSLAQVGCSYVLVGHSEERTFTPLTNETVKEKTMRVLEAGMIPVVCIGESEEIYQSGQTQEYLEEQLHLVKRAVKGAPLYIAYEPLWAIERNITPSIKELETIYDNLKLFMQGSAFLYGGNVNQETIQELNKIKQICGFLVGRSSLQIDDLKTIMNENNSN